MGEGGQAHSQANAPEASRLLRRLPSCLCLFALSLSHESSALLEGERRDTLSSDFSSEGEARRFFLQCAARAQAHGELACS
jgi:hypothetical protein